MSADGRGLYDDASDLIISTLIVAVCLLVGFGPRGIIAFLGARKLDSCFEIWNL